MKKCNKCGYEAKDSARFCKYCGTCLESEQYTKTSYCENDSDDFVSTDDVSDDLPITLGITRRK